MRDFGDFDRYVAKNKKRYAEIRGRLLAFRLKKGGSRPKDPGELKVLRILTLARMKRWKKEGRFKILGPREYFLSAF